MTCERARRARTAEREHAARENALTFKQRAGIALSKLSQAQLDAAVEAMATQAAKGDARGIAALARISQVAFGTTKEGQDDGGLIDEHTALADMTPAQRAAVMAAALERVQAHTQAAQDARDPRDESGSGLE